MLRVTFLAALGWCIGGPLTAQAAPAPIVFDFEDGLQGWELHGATQRVQSQVLGGEWAIFGDGFIEGEAVVITLPAGFPLRDFASVSWDTFFVDGDEEGPRLFLGFDLIENIFVGTPMLSWRFRPLDSPTRRVVAFIDNITFHPVPEPSSWLLLSLGLAGVVMIRRKLASRA